MLSIPFIPQRNFPFWVKLWVNVKILFCYQIQFAKLHPGASDVYHRHRSRVHRVGVVPVSVAYKGCVHLKCKVAALLADCPENRPEAGHIGIIQIRLDQLLPLFLSGIYVACRCSIPHTVQNIPVRTPSETALYTRPP